MFNLARRAPLMMSRQPATLRAAVPRTVAVTPARSYTDTVIDHYENPRNVGKLDKKDPMVGLVGAPACGDVMQLQFRVDDDGLIQDTKFKTFGCGSAIASSSLATEWLKGKSIEEAAAITNRDIAAELKLPPVKLHCSMLAADAVKEAIANFKSKRVSAE